MSLRREKLPFSSLELRAAVFAVLIRVLALYPEEDFQNPLLLRHYSVLTDYLSQHGNASTRVSQLADFLGESREGFTRRFSSETGISPKQLIDRFLMSKALDLLNGNASVKEVACLLNFSSEFAFPVFSKSTWAKRRATGGKILCRRGHIAVRNPGMPFFDDLPHKVHLQSLTDGRFPASGSITAVTGTGRFTGSQCRGRR